MLKESIHVMKMLKSSIRDKVIRVQEYLKTAFKYSGTLVILPFLITTGVQFAAEG